MYGVVQIRDLSRDVREMRAAAADQWTHIQLCSYSGQLRVLVIMGGLHSPGMNCDWPSGDHLTLSCTRSHAVLHLQVARRDRRKLGSSSQAQVAERPRASTSECFCSPHSISIDPAVP